MKEVSLSREVALRLLLFYAKEFWFSTYEKVLPGVEDTDTEESLNNATVIFYHAEPQDEERSAKVITKFAKNAKWLCGKFGTKTVVLHSFNHLGSTKAPSDVALEIVKKVKEKLDRTGYHVVMTPFGYMNEWRIHVAGESLAKVYKEI